jgi:SAM-dependent methyltransferase
MQMDEEEAKRVVRDAYAKVAKGGISIPLNPVKCSCESTDISQNISRAVGYSEEELASVPEGANLGLGCGNPTALASLKEGEIVLDLGSGAGFDCFLAANIVGAHGAVIGVDMTPEMIEKARYNARNAGYTNVEFRLGELEHLPVANGSIDVILSNCVINLVPDKAAVFKEAFRVLKSGGRFSISDMVLLKELPDLIKQSAAAYVGCLSGAILKDAYVAAIRAAGFEDVHIVEEFSFPIDCIASDPAAQAVRDGSNLTAEDVRDLADSVVSIKVAGKKP